MKTKALISCAVHIVVVKTNAQVSVLEIAHDEIRVLRLLNFFHAQLS